MRVVTGESSAGRVAGHDEEQGNRMDNIAREYAGMVAGHHEKQGDRTDNATREVTNVECAGRRQTHSLRVLGVS